MTLRWSVQIVSRAAVNCLCILRCYHDDHHCRPIFSVCAVGFLQLVLYAMTTDTICCLIRLESRRIICGTSKRDHKRQGRPLLLLEVIKSHWVPAIDDRIIHQHRHASHRPTVCGKKVSLKLFDICWATAWNFIHVLLVHTCLYINSSIFVGL